MQPDASHRAFLILGSNLGDREANLAFAREQLSEPVGRISASSQLYRTAPWGIEDQPEFINQVLELHTPLNPSELLTAIQDIEDRAGRQRTEQWGPRTLDIDILFYDAVLLNSETLTIPHPRITQRRFVLMPLAEIAGDLMHPGYGVPVSMLLDRCPDQSEVSILAGDR